LLYGRPTVYNVHLLSNLINPLVGRASTTHSIAASLRNAIIDGGLLSGEPLKQAELATFFGVSRIPVREALRQLESEGWITFLPNKGASVRPLTIEEAREIYEILSALECTALKLALPRHTPESLIRVAKILEEAADHWGQGRETLYNFQFHMTLYAPSERGTLIQIIESLRRRGERYLRLKLRVEQQWQKSDAEHHAILKACVDGNYQRAVFLLENHLLTTGEMLVRYFENESDRRNTRPADSLAALQREAATRGEVRPESERIGAVERQW
jgi:DNA-binding GntR family transcriptional regulator